MDISLHDVTSIIREKIKKTGRTTYSRSLKIEFGNGEKLQIDLFSPEVAPLIIQQEEE